MANYKQIEAAVKADIQAANDSLIYLLDLLTPMEGQQRTAQEQVYFELVLQAVKLLPVNNYNEVCKYC